MANTANNLAKVAAGGNRLAALEVLRDRLAAEIDACEYARDLPALAMRFAAVLAEIDEMPQKFGGAADVIAARRAARRTQGSA